MEPNKPPTKGKKKIAPSIHRAVVLEIFGPVKDTDYRHLLALLTHEDECFSGMILAIGTDGIRVLKNRTGPVGFREFNLTA